MENIRKLRISCQFLLHLGAINNTLAQNSEIYISSMGQVVTNPLGSVQVLYKQGLPNSGPPAPLNKDMTKSFCVKMIQMAQ